MRVVHLWQDLAVVLATAVTEQRVLAAVADIAAPALGAELVNIWMLLDDEVTLRLVTTRHTPAEVQERFDTYSARAPLPSTDALLTGEPVILHDLDERDLRYPMLKEVRVEHQGSWYCR